MNWVYYITGHGYGHIVRSVEIIKSICKFDPMATVHIRTTAFEWLFSDVLGETVFLHKSKLDIGVLQKNSFTVDKPATLKANQELLQNKKILIDIEFNFLQQNQIDIALADIPPLAFEIAEKANIPCYAVGNFSWDWIYSDFVDELPSFREIIKDIKNAYSKATCLFQLPFSGDMSVFPKSISTPLVARKAQISKQEARKILGLHDSDTLVLIALRSQDIEQVNWNNVGRLKNYKFLISSKRIDQPNFIHIPEGTLSFTDILNACDMVVSKPGYSLLSECIANQIPILYIPRQHFIEDVPLIRALKQDFKSQELDYSSFIKGDWQADLDQLLHCDKKWKSIRNDGADFIIKEVLKGKRRPA